MMSEREDLLMDVINAKRNVGNCYERLSNAVWEFEEKWDNNGVNLSANVDWKSKTTLYLIFHDKIPAEIQDILEEFTDMFNVELTEIHEEKMLKTRSRDFEYTMWHYEFSHVDRWKNL